MSLEQTNFCHIPADYLRDKDAAILMGRDFKMPHAPTIAAVMTGDLAAITQEGAMFRGRSEWTAKIRGNQLLRHKLPILSNIASSIAFGSA